MDTLGDCLFFVLAAGLADRGFGDSLVILAGILSESQPTQVDACVLLMVLPKTSAYCKQDLGHVIEMFDTILHHVVLYCIMMYCIIIDYILDVLAVVQL